MTPIEEQVVLVTGSTDGIGKLTAWKLAQTKRAAILKNTPNAGARAGL